MNPSPSIVKFEELDRVIHERARLAVMSALAPEGELSFLELKAVVGLTDGNLSVHLRLLEEAGYVRIEKSFVGRKPHTEIRMTASGRKAFQAYLDVLDRMVRKARR